MPVATEVACFWNKTKFHVNVSVCIYTGVFVCIDNQWKCLSLWTVRPLGYRLSGSENIQKFFFPFLTPFIINKINDYLIKIVLSQKKPCENFSDFVKALYCDLNIISQSVYFGRGSLQN